jgi:hypothetical protein
VFYGSNSGYGAGIHIWNASTANTASTFIDFGAGNDPVVANIHARKQSDGSSDLVLLPSDTAGNVFDSITMDGSTGNVTATGNVTVTGQVSAGGNFVTQTTGFGGLSMTCNATSGNNEIVSRRSRGTPASPTVVQSGDNLITIAGQGYDGSTYRNAAFITCAVGGPPGNSDMPGLITFSTTPDGASTPTERMRITSTGNVGIAATNPGQLLQVGDGTAFAMPLVYGNSSTYGAGIRIHNANTTNTAAAFIDFGIGADATVANIHARKQSDGSSDLVLLPSDTSGNVFDSITMDGSTASITLAGDVTINDKIIHSGDTDTAIRFPAADTFTVETAANERLRIDSSGNALMGSATTITQANVTSRLQLQGTSASASSLGCVRFSNDVNPTGVYIGKSRSGTVGTNTVVQSGDILGHLVFTGADGSNFITGAVINAVVDATPGTNDMPTRLVFGTTPDGQSASLERMRIHANGDVSINSAGAGINTTVGGASWQVSGFHAIYRNSSTAAEGIVGYYSNWGATNREVTRFQVDGNILNYNNSYGSLSDITIKENVVDATPKLDDVNRVRVVNFNRIGDPDNKQIGMVAQELKEIWPGLVSEDANGIKAIKYSVLVPILIKALQELSSKVDALADA